MVFLRGIDINWLVVLACFLTMNGWKYFSKIVGIWWPTFAFVSLGLDHMVDNIFFIPVGFWQRALKIAVEIYIWKSVIPALIDNIIRGG